MTEHDDDNKATILLVDDQPAKLLAYEVILRDLGEKLVKASSADEALEKLLKTEIAVILIDVCMPELDGFQLAAMIRDHPRFKQTAIIFISAVHLTDVDRVHGYEMGAVDYVPVPVIPEVLRAKVKVFVELYRKTRQLERSNIELERRVQERTAELEASMCRLLQSEQRRNLALAAGQMGSWDWDVIEDDWTWDEGQFRIFGIDPETFQMTPDNVRALLHAEDWERFRTAMSQFSKDKRTHQAEFRIQRPNGELRWCIGTATASFDGDERLVRISGVTIDITDRKEIEERQVLLAREVDHRARNTLAVIQSIVRLTRAETVETYAKIVEGRIKALARAHTLLSESRWRGADLVTLVKDELAPYGVESGQVRTAGPMVSLAPATAQVLALALHELATNAAKHGALSISSGKVSLNWELWSDTLFLRWLEMGGPSVEVPSLHGVGMKVIRASIEQQLRGKVIFNWMPQGLCCELSLPHGMAARVPERYEAIEAIGLKNGTAVDKRTVSGCRVLLVEDEALVAIMMADMLTDLGFPVIGPFSTPNEAISVIHDEQIGIAILDVNLGDEPVYPLADMLASRGLPFVFVTGYSLDSIDVRYRKIPVLQKPIERQALQEVLMSSLNSPKMTLRPGLAMAN